MNALLHSKTRTINNKSIKNSQYCITLVYCNVLFTTRSFYILVLLNVDDTCLIFFFTKIRHNLVRKFSRNLVLVSKKD